MKTIIEKSKILEAIANGYNTASDISNYCGYKVTSVYQYCKRNNINIYRKKSGGLNIKDLSNKTYNGIKVLCRVDAPVDIKSKRKNLAFWKCICHCGKEFIGCGADIRLNKIKTCGCQININNKRNWRGYGYISKLYWSNLNRNAKQRQIPISVTIEYLNNLFINQNLSCNLSGIKLEFTKDNCTASLDRVDSSKGYIEGNVQWVHKDINMMKQKLSDKKLFEYAKFIYLYSKNKFE